LLEHIFRGSADDLIRELCIAAACWHVKIAGLRVLHQDCLPKA